MFLEASWSGHNLWPAHFFTLLRLFIRRSRASPPPPFEVNSNGSTLTPGRGLIALGLLMDFLESINIGRPFFIVKKPPPCMLKEPIDSYPCFCFFFHNLITKLISDMIIASATDFLPFGIKSSPKAFYSARSAHIRKRPLKGRVAHSRAGLRHRSWSGFFTRIYWEFT